MLIYLDNDPNQKGSPNENFARELLELFTLGVNQYTQDDVVAAAQAWTGHNVDYNATPARLPLLPDRATTTATKTFMGTTQNWDGPQIITRVLTVEPQRSIAARFIAKKLWTFFAYPNPSADDPRHARRPRSSGRTSTSRRCCATIFLHPEFYSTTARQGLVRSPVEWVVACLKALGFTAAQTNPQWWMDQMGQQLFYPPNVAGLEEQRVLGEQHRALGTRRLRPQPHLEGRPGRLPRRDHASATRSNQHVMSDARRGRPRVQQVRPRRRRRARCRRTCAACSSNWLDGPARRGVRADVLVDALGADPAHHDDDAHSRSPARLGAPGARRRRVRRPRAAAALGPGHRAGRDVAAPVPAARRRRRRDSRPARSRSTPMLEQMRAFAAPPIGPTDGVLVLLMLDGGNDGAEHGRPRRRRRRYYDLRPHIAIPASQVLPLTRADRAAPAPHPDQDDVRPGQGRGRPGRRLPARRPQPLHVDGHLDERLGRREPARRARPAGSAATSTACPNAASESLLGVVMGSSVPLHMVGSVARASGLPQNIGGAFGIDRSHVEDARMFDAISAFGGGPTQLGQWGDLIGKTERNTLDLAQRIQPAYQGTFPESDLGRKLVLVRQAHQREPRDPRHQHEPRRLRHPRGPAGHARRPHGATSTRRSARSSTRSSPTFKSRGHAHDVLGVRPPSGGQRHQRHRPRHRGAALRHRRPGRTAGCTAPRRRSPRSTATATW